jgi:predicted DsbA family dithiol-disulfide isomerase
MSVKLEMVSDLVCPWCWVGLRRLLSALPAGADVADIDLRFRPYELDATVPREGMDQDAYMRQRFAGADQATKDRFAAMREHLVEIGHEEGIPFNFAAITRRPNTLDAHRLVRWAQGQGRGFAAKEALFAAHFSDGRDIGDPEVLVSIAKAIGLDGDLIAGLLASDADVDAVRAEEQSFQGLGVSGVPTYIADRRYALQGAESPERIQKLIAAARAAAPEERA